MSLTLIRTGPHGSQVLSSNSLEADPSDLSRWEHESCEGLTTSNGVSCPKSRVWPRCLHSGTYWRWGLRLLLSVGTFFCWLVANWVDSRQLYQALLSSHGIKKGQSTWRPKSQVPHALPSPKLVSLETPLKYGETSIKADLDYIMQKNS